MKPVLLLLLALWLGATLTFAPLRAAEPAQLREAQLAIAGMT